LGEFKRHSPKHYRSILEIRGALRRDFFKNANFAAAQDKANDYPVQ